MLSIAFFHRLNQRNRNKSRVFLLNRTTEHTLAQIPAFITEKCGGHVDRLKFKQLWALLVGSSVDCVSTDHWQLCRTNIDLRSCIAVLSWKDGGAKASHFLQRVIKGDLPSSAAFIPAGRAGHGDGWYAARLCAGQLHTSCWIKELWQCCSVQGSCRSSTVW